jgi:hypothetical protein
MTSFITPYTEDREKMSDIINRYISLGMLDKAYYYTYDEAASLESYEKIKSICSYLHGINPDVRTMATISDYTQKSSEADWAAGKDYAAGDYAAHYARGYYWMPYVFRCKRTHTSSAGADEPWKGSSWSDYWDRVNPFDYLSGYVDIYCVSTSVWDMFESKAAERRSAGDTIWTYSWYGVAKMDSHPSKLMPLMGIRYQPWLNYHYDNKGLLAWCVDWWQNCPNPWSNIKNTPSRYAEGILLYPGYQMGINGGVSSIRFEALRDGLEDYQYLWMLEQRSDRKTTQDYVDQLVTNYTTYVQDQSLLASVRDEIAGAVTTNSTASR